MKRRRMSEHRKDDLIFAGRIAEILGLHRTQVWRLLRAGVIQNAVQRDNGMWEAPRSSVEACRAQRAVSQDGRVRKPGAPGGE
jgi:hypothetical protein